MQASAARVRRRATPPDKPSPKQAVLGLLIELGRYATALELRRELNDRLKTADLSRNYVYWVLRDLAAKGQIAEGPPVTETDRFGRDRHHTRTWHVTEVGIARFRAWLRSPIADPGLRDELLIRIEFCPQEEIGVLEEHIKALERHALDEIYQLKSDSAQRPCVESQDEAIVWSHKRREIRHNAELRFWESRLKALQATLAELAPHARDPRSSDATGEDSIHQSVRTMHTSD